MNDCDDGKQYYTPSGYKLQICFGGSNKKERANVNEIFKKNGICQTGQQNLVWSPCTSQIFADQYRVRSKKKGDDWVVCGSGREKWCEGEVKINKGTTSRIYLSKSGDKINIASK